MLDAARGATCRCRRRGSKARLGGRGLLAIGTHAYCAAELCCAEQAQEHRSCMAAGCAPSDGGLAEKPGGCTQGWRWGCVECHRVGAVEQCVAGREGEV